LNTALYHGASLLPWLIISAFFAAALWETIAPERPFKLSQWRRWSQQAGLFATGTLLSRLCLPIGSLAVASWSQHAQWGLWNALGLPAGLTLVAALLSLDLGNYLSHRLFHHVPLLWRLHQIHHSDLEVDCGTAIRHHPVEQLIGNLLFILQVFLLGPPVAALLLYTMITALVEVMHHANVAIPRRANAALRRVLVTPDLHRIHHSLDPADADRNFAGIFPWWDRLFGTFTTSPARGTAALRFGIDGLQRPDEMSLPALLLHPLRRNA
jgi:sterol desaturase/sphingolipid hydroxylase (fatty acid hydroxylase superfamily)